MHFGNPPSEFDCTSGNEKGGGIFDGSLMKFSLRIFISFYTDLFACLTSIHNENGKKCDELISPFLYLIDFFLFFVISSHCFFA
jgi:uncharacterized protein with NAD-binding domain and iron-sulfur cluster